jgi:hypothetical protein
MQCLCANSGASVTCNVAVLPCYCLHASKVCIPESNIVCCCMHWQVAFLAGLPAMKGLSMPYLRVLSHCFHQVRATIAAITGAH